MAARVCPAVTVSPILTSTAVTLPVWANLRFAWVAGWIVPVADTVSLTVSVEAATSWVVVASAPAPLDRCRRNHVPAAAATTATTRTMAMTRCRRRGRRGPLAGGSGGGAAVGSPDGPGVGSEAERRLPCATDTRHPLPPWPWGLVHDVPDVRNGCWGDLGATLWTHCETGLVGPPVASILDAT